MTTAGIKNTSFYSTKMKQQIAPRTKHPWWNLDEFAVEMLNYGLALLRGLHSEMQSLI